MKKNIILTLLSMLLLQSSVFAANIKFIQVTDNHYSPGNEYKAEVLSETVKSINNEKGISFVVFTGDCIDVSNEKSLDGFLDIINDLKLPYYIVIGNHDVFKNNGLSKEKYLEIVREHNCLYKYKKPNYVFKKNGFVFIVVDGAKEVIPGSGGYFRENTLKWLDKQLTKHKNEPVVIFQHFPLVANRIIPSHEIYKKEAYFDILDKHDNVVSVIAGHLHGNSEIMRNGVYHIVTPTLLGNPHVYKIITISTSKKFSPMIYTELKEVEIPEK